MRKKCFFILIVFNICAFLLIVWSTFATRISKFGSSSEVPQVAFPFRNVVDNDGKNLNIVMLIAPFRTKDDEEKYENYKKMGLSFCGFSSYSEFPGKLTNPYEDRFHEERKHDYPSMVSAWIHIFREIPENLKKAGIPMMLMSEADFKDPNGYYKPNPEIKKEYDFLYNCLDDNPDKCEPGWNWHIRNWDLAKKCLEVMCEKFKLKGIITGRKNCEFTDKCNGIVKTLPFLPFDEFQKELQKCRFIFVPNTVDASPRVITESMCYNMPALVNYNITGGWHNIVPNVTGEFFTNEVDIIPALEKITKQQYTPRKWFMENRGPTVAGAQVAKFLVDNFPNINNKSVKYVTTPV